MYQSLLGEGALSLSTLYMFMVCIFWNKHTISQTLEKLIITIFPHVNLIQLPSKFCQLADHPGWLPRLTKLSFLLGRNRNGGEGTCLLSHALLPFTVLTPGTLTPCLLGQGPMGWEPSEGRPARLYSFVIPGPPQGLVDQRRLHERDNLKPAGLTNINNMRTCQSEVDAYFTFERILGEKCL